MNLSIPQGSSDRLLGAVQAEGVRLCLDNSHEERCSCFPQKNVNNKLYVRFEEEEVHFLHNLTVSFLNTTKLDKT